MDDTSNFFNYFFYANFSPVAIASFFLKNEIQAAEGFFSLRKKNSPEISVRVSISRNACNRSGSRDARFVISCAASPPFCVYQVDYLVLPWLSCCYSAGQMRRLTYQMSTEIIRLTRCNCAACRCQSDRIRFFARLITFPNFSNSNSGPVIWWFDCGVFTKSFFLNNFFRLNSSRVDSKSDHVCTLFFEKKIIVSENCH